MLKPSIQVGVAISMLAEHEDRSTTPSRQDQRALEDMEQGGPRNSVPL